MCKQNHKKWIYATDSLGRTPETNTALYNNCTPINMNSKNKMRCLEWVLIQSDWCSTSRRGKRDVCAQRKDPGRAVRMWPTAGHGEIKPIDTLILEF